uniref:ABC transporter permease n=1 Tax=Brachybacterium sp. GPGPB12 TaxID=3023517 RepID=UPI00404AB450
MSLVPADLDSEDPDRPEPRGDAAARTRPRDPAGRGADGAARRPVRRRGVRAERGPALAWGVLGVLAVGLAWWALTAVGGAGSPMLAALDPLGVPSALASLLATGVLVQDLVTSTLRLLLGMGIAAALGIPAGVLIGLHRPARWASAAPVQFVRMISPLSWAPVAVASLGVGSAPVVFLVAAAAIWPILLGTAAAVAAIDPRYVAVAHTLGANRREMLAHGARPLGAAGRAAVDPARPRHRLGGAGARRDAGRDQRARLRDPQRPRPPRLRRDARGDPRDRRARCRDRPARASPPDTAPGMIRAAPRGRRARVRFPPGTCNP